MGYKNVFVFGSGRCGTVCLAEALAASVTNFSVQHESLNSLCYYHPYHIEVNPQLRVVIPLLMENHPDALFVWLRRARNNVIKSYARLDKGAWVNHWWVMVNTVRPVKRIEQAEIAVDDIIRQCEHAFNLIPPLQRMCVDIENSDAWITELWDMMGADGNIELAKSLLNIPKNTSEERGDA